MLQANALLKINPRFKLNSATANTFYELLLASLGCNVQSFPRHKGESARLMYWTNSEGLGQYRLKVKDWGGIQYRS